MYQLSAVFGDTLNKCCVVRIGHIHSSLWQRFFFFGILWNFHQSTFCGQTYATIKQAKQI